MKRVIASGLALFALLAPTPGFFLEAKASDEAETTAVTAEGQEDSDNQEQWDDEQDMASDDEEEGNGLDSVLSMLGKQMNVNLDGEALSKAADTIKELTSHIDAAYSHHTETNKRTHPILKKVMSKRAHDKLTSVIRKMYKNVSKEELDEQIYAITALLQNLKDDPHMTSDKLLQKTAGHLGISLTPDIVENMREHMNWIDKMFNLIGPHLLGEEKAEEL